MLNIELLYTGTLSIARGKHIRISIKTFDRPLTNYLFVFIFLRYTIVKKY